MRLLEVTGPQVAESSEPDLLVEILSPDTRKTDEVTKRKLTAEHEDVLTTPLLLEFAAVAADISACNTYVERRARCRRRDEASPRSFRPRSCTSSPCPDADRNPARGLIPSPVESMKYQALDRPVESRQRDESQG